MLDDLADFELKASDWKSKFLSDEELSQALHAIDEAQND
jgi:hypothetical protein